MSLQTIVMLSLFALLMVGTPGPANILAMASGANFGFRASIPFMVGLVCGKVLLAVAMSLGLLGLLSLHPLVNDTLRIASAIYLLWLAWKVLGMKLRNTAGKNVKRPGFLAGFSVHPINPKAWAMLSSAYVQFTHPESGNWVGQSITVIVVFFILPAVVHPLWCLGGAKLGRMLSGTVWEKLLMRVLALSIVAVVGWALYSHEWQ